MTTDLLPRRQLTLAEAFQFWSEPETWASVPDWASTYEASSYGRMRSIPRVITRRDGLVQPLKGRILNPKQNRAGYRPIELQNPGRSWETYIHVVVATTFICPRPGDLQVRHLDGDAGNNAPWNLAWGTYSENAFDRVRHGTSRWRRCCPRGHVRFPPNVTNEFYKNGTRKCLACHRARSQVVLHPELDMDSLSDAYYAEILRHAERAA